MEPRAALLSAAPFASTDTRFSRHCIERERAGLARSIAQQQRRAAERRSWTSARAAAHGLPTLPTATPPRTAGPTASSPPALLTAPVAPFVAAWTTAAKALPRFTIDEITLPPVSLGRSMRSISLPSLHHEPDPNQPPRGWSPELRGKYGTTTHSGAARRLLLPRDRYFPQTFILPEDVRAAQMLAGR